MMSSIGASCICKLLTKRWHAGWEVDVIEVSNTAPMLRGYLVRAEEIRTWSRVDTFAAEGLDGECGGLLYDRHSKRLSGSITMT